MWCFHFVNPISRKAWFSIQRGKSIESLAVFQLHSPGAKEKDACKSSLNMLGKTVRLSFVFFWFFWLHIYFVSLPFSLCPLLLGYLISNHCPHSHHLGECSCRCLHLFFPRTGTHLHNILLCGVLSCITDVNCCCCTTIYM